jgi:hypothetical protein
MINPSCRFVEHLNEMVSLATFLKILNFPLLLCMTGFQMTQVKLYVAHVSQPYRPPWPVTGIALPYFNIGYERMSHRTDLQALKMAKYPSLK